jgi:uncharacterized DUF497 family protein
MNYEWDEQKRAINFAKHGVDFVAAENFNWSLSLIELDSRYDYSEQRFNALAPIENRIYAMTFTWRGDKVRIISFRKANKREVNYYVNNIENNNTDR